MKVTVNGKEIPMRADQTVQELLIDLGMGGRAVAVELNREVVPRQQHFETSLQDGDMIEIVTLVGGG